MLSYYYIDWWIQHNIIYMEPSREIKENVVFCTHRELYNVICTIYIYFVQQDCTKISEYIAKCTIPDLVCNIGII